MSGLNKIPLAKKEEERPDNSLNVKEVGFMLRLIDEGVHQGKFLEHSQIYK